MKSIIQFLNCNDGACSLLLSTVAIIISIVAIRSQTKAALIDKRLSLYSEIEAVLLCVRRIIELYRPSSPLMAKKAIIKTLLFQFGSTEFHIVDQVISIECKQNRSKKVSKKLKKQQKELLNEYVRIYAQKKDYYFISKVKLMFSRKKAAECFSILYSRYDDIKLSLLLINEKELDRKINELKVALDTCEKHNILNKFLKDLPLNGRYRCFFPCSHLCNLKNRK